MTLHQIKNDLKNMKKDLESKTLMDNGLIIYDKYENIPKELLDDDSLPVRIFIPDNGRDPDMFHQEKHYLELIIQSRARRKELGLPEWKDEDFR